MLIRSFWAKGYRSLRDVKLDDLGPFNVFYGPNGAGKSNVLSALQALFRLLELRFRPDFSFKNLKERWSYTHYANVARLRPGERCNLVHSPTLTLGATIEWGDSDVRLGLPPVRFSTLTVEVLAEWDIQAMRITRLETDRFDVIDRKPHQQSALREAQSEANEAGTAFDPVAYVTSELGLCDCKTDDDYWQAIQQVVHWVARHAITVVDASRFPRFEKLSDRTRDIGWLLSRGRLKEAFYRASLHPDGLVRRRYKQLQELLGGPPLERPPFDITIDPETEEIDLRERAPDSPYEAAEVSLDLAGLGVAQLYSILGSILLQPARAVGIEEPEAHLHARTTGRQLRELLERLVKTERYIDQLFIATHSNLFDLDPAGYFDVSHSGEQGTVIERKPLIEIDRHHLYEPGPAKHALLRSLEYLDTDDIVFRRSDTNEAVTVGEMIDMLQRDDELAFDFLDDVHAAAVRAVRVQSKKGSPAR